MVFPVLIRIHCGIGRFCFSFFANFCLIRKVLWAAIVAQNDSNMAAFHSAGNETNNKGGNDV